MYKKMTNLNTYFSYRNGAAEKTQITAKLVKN
jgi:hypothetical protein